MHCILPGGDETLKLISSKICHAKVNFFCVLPNSIYLISIQRYLKPDSVCDVCMLESVFTGQMKQHFASCAEQRANLRSDICKMAAVSQCAGNNSLLPLTFPPPPAHPHGAKRFNVSRGSIKSDHAWNF